MRTWNSWSSTCAFQHCLFNITPHPDSPVIGWYSGHYIRTPPNPKLHAAFLNHLGDDNFPFVLKDGLLDLIKIKSCEKIPWYHALHFLAVESISNNHQDKHWKLLPRKYCRRWHCVRKHNSLPKLIAAAKLISFDRVRSASYKCTGGSFSITISDRGGLCYADVYSYLEPEPLQRSKYEFLDKIWFCDLVVS